MNLLTKKELYDNCDDDTILKDFFEEFSYLEELGEKNYKELNDEEKIKVDELLENADFISLIIVEMINSEKYLKKKNKIVIDIIGLLDKNITTKLDAHYDLLKNYLKRAQEIMYLVETKNNRTISDITIAYCLSFLSYISLINDLGKNDFEMLNKGNYVDTDFKDFKQLKNDAKAYELSLIQRNRVYKKETIYKLIK